MLCITRHESMAIITIGGLGLDHVQLGLILISPNPQYTGRIVLSWNLLSWILVGVESPVPLLILLQLQIYLVPFISAWIIIIPKLQNIHFIKFIRELFSLCNEHLLIVIR